MAIKQHLRELLAVLLLVNLFVACHPERRQSPLELFRAKSYLVVHNSFRVDILNPEFINTAESLSKPVLTWQKLMRFTTYDETLSAPSDYCLFYLIPKSTGNFTYKGILKIVQAERTTACDQIYVREAYTQLDEIDELQVFLESDRKFLQSENFTLNPFTLVFKIKIGEKTDWLEIPIYNITRADMLYRSESHPARLAYHHAKFSTGVRETLVPSVSVLGIFPKDFKTAADWNYLGNFTDTYLEKKSQVCQSVTPECVLSPGICEMCRYGFYEVVRSNCVLGNPKLCGPNRCGERGEPACPRGFLWEKGIPKQACFDDSNAGFCRPGLKTVCDENKILICL